MKVHLSSRASAVLLTALAGLMTCRSMAGDGESIGSSGAGSVAGQSADARAVHQSMLVLDTHLDTPIHFGRPGWSIMDRHRFDQDLSQVDYPRMIDGGLDGGFFVISTGQGPLTAEGYAAARDFALLKAVQIREVVAGSGGHLELATQAADAQRIVAAGKRVVFQSIENSYPLGEDLSLLSTFQQLGVRLLGVVHVRNNQFADSATDSPRWNGLSPLGRKLISEANRLGLVVDASHASDAAFDQMIELSRSPIILSHSNLKATVDHPRNLDDARLKKLAASGGVIQLLAVGPYLVSTPKVPELDAASAYYEKLPAMDSREAAALAAQLHDLRIKHHVPQATLEIFMQSLRHAIDVAGIDHVGLGIDWDGGGGVTGLMDVGDLPSITVGLLKAGYSQTDVQRVMSGNTLRVLRQAAEAAASAQPR